VPDVSRHGNNAQRGRKRTASAVESRQNHRWKCTGQGGKRFAHEHTVPLPSEGVVLGYDAISVRRLTQPREGPASQLITQTPAVGSENAPISALGDVVQSPQATATRRPRRSKGLTAAAMLGGAVVFGWGGHWLNMMTAHVPKPPVTATHAIVEPKNHADVAGKVVTRSQSAPTAQRKRSGHGAGHEPEMTATNTARHSTPTAVGVEKQPARSSLPIASRRVPELDLPPRVAAPVEPFLAPTDVTESPRVVARVEPKVPTHLQHQDIDDVVVVRVLVSQVGQPSRVSVLRHSKFGVALDDAVIAAVTQWSFSPARKKGAPVSSWFNLGIPIRSNG
jgi:TonB family protein